MSSVPAWLNQKIPAWREHWPAWLLAGALAVYLLTRWAGLADYPIYFFTDEAAQSVLARDFLRGGLRNSAGDLLPAYFLNVYQYNLGVSVYLQLVPNLIPGRSVEAARGAPALVTLLAPLWLGLALKNVYRRQDAWLAALLLSITPAWFLHSRTAFETSLAVTFYAGMLYFYLRYRGGQVRALYAALLCGALAFYSYSPAMVVAPLTALLFGLSDARYHWQHRSTLLLTAGLALLCVLPFLRFQLEHPGETLTHLTQIRSTLVLPVPWSEKLAAIGAEYLRGLDPLYWYAPYRDSPRHTMDGLGNLLAASLPLGIAGVGLAAWRIHRWEYRIPLLALLAAPAGAALVGLGVTRALFLVIPMALLGALAGSELLAWAVTHFRLARAGASLGAWLALSGFNVFLLAAALTGGPTWSTNYGLDGMQYGARQVFAAVRDFAVAHPGVPIVVSPTWANGTDILARFFLPDPSPVMLEGIDHWLNDKNPLPENMLFILPPDETERARASGKFSRVQVERILPYPDGQPGFSFVRLAYAANVDAIFASEWEDRRTLLRAQLTLAGQPALVQYSRLDMGGIEDIFDGEPETFLRSLAANPLVIRVDFSQARRLRGLTALIGGAPSVLDVSAGIEGDDRTYRWRRQVLGAPRPRPLSLDFEGELPVRWVEIRLKNTDDPEPGHVHLWELELH